MLGLVWGLVGMLCEAACRRFAIVAWFPEVTRLLVLKCRHSTAICGILVLFCFTCTLTLLI